MSPTLQYGLLALGALCVAFPTIKKYLPKVLSMFKRAPQNDVAVSGTLESFEDGSDDEDVAERLIDCIFDFRDRQNQTGVDSCMAALKELTTVRSPSDAP